MTRDEDLNTVNSKQLANLGVVDMSNPQTLVDFATWTIQNYPADKYVLILSDHGMGWPGGFSAASARSRATTNVPLAQAINGQIFLNELDAALGQIRQRAGIDQFEFVGLDACLMSQLEVYSALAPHARYSVASEETEPALGWAYRSFLGTLAQNPDVTGADLGRAIVESYIVRDERIVDDRARNDFLRKGSPMGGFFNSVGAPAAAQLAQEMGDSVTLTAVDLSAIPALNQSVNQLALALQGTSQAAVDKARSYAQSYTSIFGDQVPPSFIDLGHFAALAARTTNSPDVTQAAIGVLNALKTAVLAEKHGPKKPGSTGISIYFPNSQLFKSPVAGPQSYNIVAQRFASESLWPGFLTFHYTGRKFAAGAAAAGSAIPSRSTTITAPGAGQIRIAPVQLSSKTVAIRKSIKMKADVTGDNIGYVYFFTGYLDKQGNSINVADTDYLESPQSHQLNGVTYPDWGGRTQFTLEFDWEPLMFSITDGKTSAQVLLAPQSYGEAPELAVYTVEGIYTFTSGEQRYARLYFSNGLLRQVLGFAGDKLDGTGPAREIVPQTGDRFTVLEKWIDLDANGKMQQTATQQGATLIFGDRTFTWKQLDAAAGQYIVGFIVTDLDGNSTHSFATVTVQ